MAKPTKLVLVVLAALLLTAATLLIVLPMRGGSGGTPTATRSSETTASTGAAGPSATAGTTDVRTLPRASSEHRAAKRAAMIAAIASAREARDRRTAAATRVPAPSGATTEPGADSTATTLDIKDKSGDTSDWGKRALGTLNTLLGQCYDLGRAEDSELAGSITLRFTLVGEPDVGGLLEHVEIVDTNTTITQQTLHDCFTEQLYALELDPPPDGLKVERELSLRFP